MPTFEFTSASVTAALEGLPEVRTILDAVSEESGLSVAIYGGALRDLALRGAPGHDLDVIVYGDSTIDFREAMQRVGARTSAKLIDYPGSHIVVTPQSSGVFLDIHYPKESFLAGLVRSDLSINAIGFLWKERQLTDPFEGIRDLDERKIRMHSPQYAVTNPANFPRIFRTAAAVGFPIEGTTEGILRRCAVMIGLQDGRANVRTLLELLKFLSAPTIGPYLAQMHRFRLIESLIPELTPAASVGVSPQQSILDRNVALAAALDSIETTDQIRHFLSADLGRAVTNRGFIRFIALFLDLGNAYYLFDRTAPYIQVVSNGDAERFARHSETRLLSHIAARYAEAKELSTFLAGIPEVLSFLAQTGSPNPPESLGPQDRDRAVLLRALIRSIQSS